MVIGAFPAAKLGVLAIKQISKPVANVIKANAKQSEAFRKYVCMPPAQFYNWCEVKTKMWALNLGRPVTVPPLNEAMAIELGANLLGEFIIFAIGAGLLILEYARQSKNEYKKQETQKQDRASLVTQLSEMGFRLERQDAQIRELTRLLADVGPTSSNQNEVDNSKKDKDKSKSNSKIVDTKSLSKIQETKESIQSQKQIQNVSEIVAKK